MLEDPTDWELHCRLGEQFEREGKFDEAISSHWNAVYHAPRFQKHQAYHFALNAVRRLPIEALDRLVTCHDDPSDVPSTSVLVSLPVWYAIAENLYSNRHGTLEHLKKQFKQNGTIYLGTVFNNEKRILIHENGTPYSIRSHLKLPDQKAHDLDELMTRSEWKQPLKQLLMPHSHDTMKEVFNGVAAYQLLNTYYKNVKVQIDPDFHRKPIVRGLIHITDDTVHVSCKPYDNDSVVYALKVD